MASKRHIRRRSCGGKVKHATKTGALIALHKTKKYALGRMHAYKCSFCSGWHVGHTPKQVAQIIEARG